MYCLKQLQSTDMRASGTAESRGPNHIRKAWFSSPSLSSASSVGIILRASFFMVNQMATSSSGLT